MMTPNTLTRRDLVRLGLAAGAASTLGLGAAAGEETPKPASPAPVPSASPSGYLDSAVKAAQWIHTARIETSRGLIWLDGPERPEGFQSTPDLYTGAAGIVLFLLELARATGDKTYKEDAGHGADSLIASLPAKLDPDNGETGLYQGAAGVGFTLRQVFQATGDEKYRQGALRCRDLIHAAAQPVGRGVAWGKSADIIAGASGTGLYLLDYARTMNDPASRDLAAQAGLRLIELGIPDGGGLKWRENPVFPRFMPNFSHGTAGVAYFLATLHQETGRREFLDAALAGAHYLQSIAVTEGDSCLIFHDEPDNKKLYYLGWCHGPVGTSRLWLRLHQIDPKGGWLAWARKERTASSKAASPKSRPPASGTTSANAAAPPESPISSSTSESSPATPPTSTSIAAWYATSSTTPPRPPEAASSGPTPSTASSRSTSTPRRGTCRARQGSGWYSCGGRRRRGGRSGGCGCRIRRSARNIATPTKECRPGTYLMARPKIFISSTYYDLKHVRSSLDRFVHSLGFDAILSEKGKIAYYPDRPLDESCYREVDNADIFVLIVGGRYGSESSTDRAKPHKEFYDRYTSITQREYIKASDRDIPTYILVERSVQAEYETYTKNRDNQGVYYAHVDSINVFQLIEYIREQPRNNPTFQFDDYPDIESWLREQWAGLFRELLVRMKDHAQLASLQGQVRQLSQLNQTLKIYLEEVVSQVSPKKSQRIIAAETKRLDDLRVADLLNDNDMGEFLIDSYKLSVEQIREALRRSESFDEFARLLLSMAPDEELREVVEFWIESEAEMVVASYCRLRDLFATLEAFPSLSQAPAQTNER
jgi:hypothetical protein